MALPFASRRDLDTLVADVEALRQQLNSISSSVTAISGQNDTLLRLIQELILHENRTDFLHQQLANGNVSIGGAFLAQVKKDCAEFRTVIDACIVLNNSLEGEKSKIARAVKKSLPLVKSKIARALASIAKYKSQVETSFGEKKVAPEVAQKYQAEFARLASNIEIIGGRLSALEQVLNQIAAEIAKIELKDNPEEDKTALREAESNAKEGTEEQAYQALNAVAAKLVRYRSFGDSVHSELSRISGVASQAYNELAFLERSIVSLRGEVAAMLVGIHRDKLKPSDSERIVNDFKLKLAGLFGELQKGIDLRSQVKGQQPGGNFLSPINSAASRAFLEKAEALLKSTQRIVRDCRYLLPSVKNRLYLMQLESGSTYEQMKNGFQWLNGAERFLEELNGILSNMLAKIVQIRPEIGKIGAALKNEELVNTFFGNLGYFERLLEQSRGIREELPRPSSH